MGWFTNNRAAHRPGDPAPEDSVLLTCRCGTTAIERGADLDFRTLLHLAQGRGWSGFGEAAEGRNGLMVAAICDRRGGTRASVVARCPQCGAEVQS